MTDPVAKPAAAAHAEKKGGLNWGLPIFIILMGVGLAFFAEFVYARKDAFEWLREFVFRVGVPAALIGLLFFVFKDKKDKKDGH